MATTFDPNYKSAGFALSGGNLTATASAAAMVAGTRSISGLTYFECKPTTLGTTPGVGLINSSSVSSPGAANLGADLNSLAFRSGGTVVLNNVTLTTIQTYAVNDVIGVAVDPQNRLIWFRTNTGNWNNSATANPATTTEGIDYSTMNCGRVLPAVGSATTTVWVGAFTTFLNTAPSGFVTVDTVQVGAVRAPLQGPSVPVAAVGAGPTARSCQMGTDNYAKRYFAPAGVITTVNGVVSENGVVIAGKKVWVYDRISGDLIGDAVSASDGTWSIACLGRPSVLVVCSDPTTYNSIVYDNVTPG
jgi:hypothetical protein